MDHSDVVDAVMQAIEHYNAIFPGEQLAKSLDEPLYGGDGKLDSFGLVNLVVSVEEKVEEKFGISLTLANERAISQRNSPFRTVGTLVDWVKTLLEEHSENG